MGGLADDACRLVNALDTEARANLRDCTTPAALEAGRRILEAAPELQIAVIPFAFQDAQMGQTSSARFHVLIDLLRRKLPYTSMDLEQVVLAAAQHNQFWGQWTTVLTIVQRWRETHEWTPLLRDALQKMYDSVHTGGTDGRKLKAQMAVLLGTANMHLPDAGEAWSDAALADLDGMESAQRTAWEALLTHAATTSGGKPSAKWQKEADRLTAAIANADFARHAASWMSKLTPPLPFMETAPQQPDLTGVPMPVTQSAIYTEYREAYAAHYARVSEYLSHISEKNIDLLKGLAWCCAGRAEPELARALARMTLSAFQSVPHKGTWAARAGNAAIYALGQMTCAPEAVGQLSRLRAKMRDRSALKAIAVAIEQVAARSGMAADDLEDIAVPTGGLDPDGKRHIVFGDDGSALLSLHPQTGHISLQWFGADGKERKSVPAAVKKTYAEDVKALKAAAEEVQQTLSAQAARLDRALLDERGWTYTDWEARFLSHPLLGNLARRLVWAASSQQDIASTTCGEVRVEQDFIPLSPSQHVRSIESDAESPPPKIGPSIACDWSGQQGPSSRIKLWHPITSMPEEVMRWRDNLANLGIVQPFKQAHREVYLLTDAERNTRTYSNRFGAHILKQHQFNSLCVLRGWKNKLRLMVDDSYPPATRELPLHNLRAEFWIEGIGDDYGTDTNDAGTYLRLSTDQVRFYPILAPANDAHASGGGYSTAWRQTPVDPLPLDQIPSLVLSEILRDVDLFVGVASVGNDPTWADGGPEGRFRNYWQDYAFGDLGETAKTRRAVLERLLPRLKIASRCELSDRFLSVRGELRTYKIHLGSGNILMEPNDQYLCIVPNSQGGGAGDLFLPFEGDRTLAIILSKALLLADDTKITDPTIMRQIR